jgi:hypothetical protein
VYYGFVSMVSMDGTGSTFREAPIFVFSELLNIIARLMTVVLSMVTKLLLRIRLSGQPGQH